MRNSKAFFAGLLSVLVLSGAASAAPENWYSVSEVIDGGKVRLTSGAVIAYASLRAPDPASESESVRGFAGESLAFNRSLVEGRKVRVVWGSRIRNAKGDYLALVHLEDGTLVNRRILEEGFAALAIEAPNLEHASEFRKVAAEARRLHRGLWRHELGIAKAAIQYIGDEMTRDYHVPDCPLLTGVARGHRREFGSAVDATAAGFDLCSKCKRMATQDTDLF